jgi:DNA-binding MarR family transcriptional regulator/N-acetylglutamate synthase-like GNAT family acetyltransferase
MGASAAVPARKGPRDPRVEAIRRFNRFYTQRIGVLGEGLLHSPFSLTEARVLYELAHRDRPAAVDLCTDLALDPGYSSRILRRLEKLGLVRRLAADDRRRHILALTERGRTTFADLDARSAEEISRLIAPLSEPDRARFADALTSAQSLLGATFASDPASRADSIALRAHQPGDIGWVVERHGALYASEYGWDVRFEGLVAKIAGAFLEKNDPRVERAFIAERDGKRIGSVFLVRGSKRVARLRLLLVEPEARGVGLGRRLVEECIRFARESGYRKIVLWTQRNLLAARAIYRATGFRKTGEERHTSFGAKLVAETWEVDLVRASRRAGRAIRAPKS